MKLIHILTISLSLLISFCSHGQIGVNNVTPDGSAVLDLKSSTQGVLVPRMTTEQRLAVGSPANSLLVFDTTVGKFYYYNGTAWNTLDAWNQISGGISYTGQVAVNTTTPSSSAALDLTSTSKGVLVPRMTTAQRLAISSP